MSNKSIFIICAMLTAVIGFWGGFAITKAIVSNQNGDAVDVITLNDNSVGKNITSIPSIDKNPKEAETLPADGSDVVVEAPVETLKEVPIKKEVVNDCPTPSKEYQDESLLDVGQDVGLEDKHYIPSDLVKLDKDISKYPTLCIKKEVAEALKSMLEAASKEGYTIIVSSAFRDYETQKFIVDREKKNGNKNVSVAVAKPGYSEHQLGVAIDVTSKSIAYASAAGKFAESPEAKWLELHAIEYGFMESYPKGMQDITGYMYEPWHYRYVGIDTAKEIVKNSQTINQYLKARKESETDKNEVGG